jgi:hypothetical protein
MSNISSGHFYILLEKTAIHILGPFFICFFAIEL